MTNEHAKKELSALMTREPDFAVALDMAIKALEKQIPQKTGHWIQQNKGVMVTTYKCSVCGRIVGDDTGYNVYEDYPYCNCGAKMEGDKND